MSEGEIKRKILLAVDDSPIAKHAFQWYVSNMAKPGDSVLAISCFETPVFAFDPLTEEALKVIEDYKRDAAASLTKIHKEMEQHASVKGFGWMSLVKEGDPRDEICDIVEHENVDTVIIGSRGQGAMKRVLLGSVSTYVLHHVKVPVVIVRDD